jgi:hypothetical protein
MLREGSGIADGVILARGYRTITDPQELHTLGFARNQCLVPTLLLPVHATDGGNSLYTHRPNLPRVIQNRHKRNPDGSFKAEVIKYELPRPQPQPAPPQVELLDCAPPVIHRPLALVNGRAYAAIWPYVSVTVTEALDDDGNIIKYEEPKAHTEQRLLEMSKQEATVNTRAKLIGRNLEPWRPILAVAAWSEDKGVKGLWERMEKLALIYQGERQEMESTDLAVLVVRAICKCLVPDCDVSSFCDVLTFFVEPQKTFLKTSQITETAKEIAEGEELGIDAELIVEKRIGWILKKLRVTKCREPGTGKRGWMISPFEMQRYVNAYGLYTPEKTSQNDKTSQTANDGQVELDNVSDERETFEL